MADNRIMNESSSNRQLVNKIRYICTLVDQTIERSTHVQERGRLIQQQLQQAEDRVDRLLSYKFSHPSLVGGEFRQNTTLVAPLQESPMVAQLQQQLQQRSELLRRSCHDLKASFSLIGGASSLIAQAQTDQERQSLIEMLQRNLRQANHLIGELLDVTRLEAGEEQIRLSRFNVAELLGGIVESLRSVADQRGLQLQQQGPAHLMIEGDSVKLIRIVQNLLLNALTYTRLGGVMLAWGREPAGTRWRLSVTDTGPGLSASAQRTSASGEGIGLLIVRQLCSLLKGKLEIEELLEEAGTRFTLRFPFYYVA